LLRLAERIDLSLTGEQIIFLARFDRYQVEGRYPNPLPLEPDVSIAEAELRKAQEVFEWLIQQL